MKIYTKTGDNGTTGLYGGTRVSKASERIEAYGTIDELNAYIGLLRDIDTNLERKIHLKSIQNNLFVIGSLLAASPEKEKLKLPFLSEDAILDLEKEIDKMETNLPPLKNFILPGGNMHISYCHVARCVCRRAERATVHAGEITPIQQNIIPYLNRLSDYLFVLSRKIGADLNVEENIWNS